MPVVAGEGLQGGSVVGEQHVGGGSSSAVPHVSLALGYGCGVGAYDHAIGCLPGSLPGVLQAPGKAGRGVVDAQGVAEVFALQGDGGAGGCAVCGQCFHAFHVEHGRGVDRVCRRGGAFASAGAQGGADG